MLAPSTNAKLLLDAPLNACAVFWCSACLCLQADSGPAAPTALGLGAGRDTAVEILALLQKQPPPPPLKDDDALEKARDPWAGMKIY